MTRRSNLQRINIGHPQTVRPIEDWTFFAGMALTLLAPPVLSGTLTNELAWLLGVSHGLGALLGLIRYNWASKMPPSCVPPNSQANTMENRWVIETKKAA